jgi:hypothetical protein
MATRDTIFREYWVSDAERSDHSAGDQLRHRQKVRDSVEGFVCAGLGNRNLTEQSYRWW